MLRRLRQTFRDMKTIKSLCERAEQHANASGHTEPGAEHFILAAFDLPDGTARQAFRRANADPAQFEAAIARQYGLALQDLGMTTPSGSPPAVVPVRVPAGTGPFRAKPAVKALMDALWQLRKADAAPLLGAHVVLAALSATYGVTPRSLQCMGLDPAHLATSARDEIAAYPAA